MSLASVLLTENPEGWSHTRGRRHAIAVPAERAFVEAAHIQDRPGLVSRVESEEISGDETYGTLSDEDILRVTGLCALSRSVIARRQSGGLP